MESILKIENLSASVAGREILKNVSLTFRSGETHAIMGRNGSGKSSLVKILAGHPDYQVTGGKIFLTQGQEEYDLSTLSPSERANKGLFLAFQYPVEIPGLSHRAFLKTALNERRKELGQKELDSYDFETFLMQKIDELQYNTEFLNRSVNVGFSGGEKKRGEILQLAVLDPAFSFLDEIDSGLDIDALHLVLSQIQRLKTPENAWIFITHYASVIESIRPDWVHILHEGQLLLSTQETDLTKTIQKEGFEFLLSPEGAS